MLKLKEVYKTYKNGVNALYNVNLFIEQGEFVYIIGPTGSGKSTLIKLIDAEERPSKGLVEVAGINIGKLRNGRIPFYRRYIGVVYQDYKLLPRKTVFENVMLALEIGNMALLPARNRVREVLDLVGLSDKANSYPDQLSGGQQQRCVIARAIANKPKLLIADEPTGNLDFAKAKEIVQLLEFINREEKTTVLVVTHDVDIVNTMRKRTIALEDGHLVADIKEGGYHSNA
ncbi:MAG: cell division ATP-binding protein FtsE [Erysipelotrichaceae bacterium]|nr:MAG: cell division ATP-binding protein [Erysipelotrichaceae bacterium]TXT19485.1 MAG: cell division ATP-binding protein FtsE [Erysipelotrichaceae bacterium]